MIALLRVSSPHPGCQLKTWPNASCIWHSRAEDEITSVWWSCSARCRWTRSRPCFSLWSTLHPSLDNLSLSVVPLIVSSRTEVWLADHFCSLCCTHHEHAAFFLED